MVRLRRKIRRSSTPTAKLASKAMRVKSFIRQNRSAFQSFFRRTRGVISEVRKAVRADKRRQLTAPAIPVIAMELAIPSFVTGIIYVAVFLPLAWISAQQAGIDPLGALLLQDAPTFWVHGSHLAFPPWGSVAARPALFAWGVLYGAIGLVAAAVLVTGGLHRLVIASNGVFFGYFFTAWTAVQLDILPAEAFDKKVLHFELGYVLLSYYMASALAIAFSRNELARARYDFVFSGSQAIAAGWILGRGFGPYAPVFAGLLYTACTFVTLTICETLFLKVFRVGAAVAGASAKQAWPQLCEERFISYKQLHSSAGRAWRKNEIAIIVGSLLFLFWPIGLVVVRAAIFE